ncbi:MAG TPA: hypothetical protein PKH77_02615 [Anaerolineae bacterium]|nr:hypothetical protein [Anaerolineae bacterium]
MNAAEVLTSHLGAGLFLAMLYLNWLLRVLSRRMGEVTRMPPHYKWFDVGMLLILTATLSYLLMCSVALVSPPVIKLTPALLLTLFYLPLTLGVSLNLSVAAIYWGWLLRER